MGSVFHTNRAGGNNVDGGESKPGQYLSRVAMWVRLVVVKEMDCSPQVYGLF